MDTLKSLERAPFDLDGKAIAWVRATLAGLSTENRLRQLFVHVAFGDDPAAAVALARRKPGGIHRFIGGDLEAAWRATRAAAEASEIPLFVTGDIEGGGWSPPAMTRFTNQLGLAAADDPALTSRLLGAVAREARALGFNWTFTPVVDISANFHSAVVGTRSFGSDIGRIIAHAKAGIAAFQAAGLAATVKHWPGEGHDQRDQHLVTTINPLSLEDWENTFGRIYRETIAAGVMSVMSAHIALPALAKSLGVKDGLELYRPASLSFELTTVLLRERLGFNGLIVSDATPMAGFGGFMARADAVPLAVAAGCDVFLFSRDLDGDLQFMADGLRKGILSEHRLEEAVTRILGLKAALGLHAMSIDQLVPPFANVRDLVTQGEAGSLAREAAARSVTRVKDVGGLLPLDPLKHRRIVVVNAGGKPHGASPDAPDTGVFRDALAKRGFELRDYDPHDPPSAANSGLVLFVAAQESGPSLSRIFLDWQAAQGDFLHSMDRYWFDVPTVMVSFGHPYYLFDVPRMPVYVNAYSLTPDCQEAVARKLAGEEPFTGVSPVDAFCGLPDARF